MENNIVIASEDGRLQAEISPDYGGMVTALRVEDKEVLFLDKTKLATSPVTAGGIPILFPFAGKTRDDRYVIGEKTYYMPMHGLLKNRSFAVKEAGKDFVELWMRNDDAVIHRNYPFDCVVSILYQISKESLLIKMKIENKSDKTLIHALGWHPYYKVTDLASATLKHHMMNQYDYVLCKDLEAEREIDLKQPLDNVYFHPAANEYVLENRKDGYRVECIMDEAYKSLVIYNGTPGSVCIEPWCGIPDTANNRRFIQEIEPGCNKEYSLLLKLERV